jgi:hypothetical protein
MPERLVRVLYSPDKGYELETKTGESRLGEERWDNCPTILSQEVWRHLGEEHLKSDKPSLNGHIYKQEGAGRLGHAEEKRLEKFLEAVVCLAHKHSIYERSFAKMERICTQVLEGNMSITDLKSGGFICQLRKG